MRVLPGTAETKHDMPVIPVLMNYEHVFNPSTHEHADNPTTQEVEAGG